MSACELADEARASVMHPAVRATIRCDAAI
jgi:hypothetical protein